MDEELNEYFNNKKVIFVGPSPEIKHNGDKFGQFIDSFDIVIRTGGGMKITKLYSNFIGKKTDVIIINDPFIISPEFNFDYYQNSDVRYIYNYGGLNKKNIRTNKVKLLNMKYLSNIIKSYIKMDKVDPFTGMFITSEVLQYNPTEYYIVGVSNYTDNNIIFDGYLPSIIKPIDIKKRQQKFHPNSKNEQYEYFKKLLNDNKIKMDEHSLKYFK